MPPSFFNPISFVAFFAIRAPINSSTITAYWLLNASISKSTVSHKLGPGRSLTTKEKVALWKINELKMIFIILPHGDICQKNLFPVTCLLFSLPSYFSDKINEDHFGTCTLPIQYEPYFYLVNITAMLEYLLY